MAEIREIARVTAAGRKIPDVSKNELPGNAWLVWEYARLAADRQKGDSRQTLNGVDGFRWYGTMASAFRLLWPRIDDGVGPAKAEASQAKTKIGAYLRDTGNMVCLDRGNPKNVIAQPPTWWVRAVWNEEVPTDRRPDSVTPTPAERKLTPDEAGENRDPEPVTVTRVERAETFTCERCGESWASRAALSAHAKRHLNEDAAAAASREVDEEVEPERVDCPRCDETFSKGSPLLNHLTKHENRDKAIDAAARVLARGERVTAKTLCAELGLKSNTVIYSWFNSVAELHELATQRLQADGQWRQRVAPEPAPVSLRRMGGVDRSSEEALVRLIVVAHEEGMTLTASAINALIGSARQNEYEYGDDGLVARGLVTIIGSKAKRWLPGPNAPKLMITDAASESFDHVEAIKRIVSEIEDLRSRVNDAAAAKTAAESRLSAITKLLSGE